MEDGGRSYLALDHPQTETNTPRAAGGPEMYKGQQGSCRLKDEETKGQGKFASPGTSARKKKE